MGGGSVHQDAPPTWRQAALLSLAERTPLLAGITAVVPIVDDDAAGLAAVAVTVVVLVALGSWLARRAAESMGVARTELPGSVRVPEIVALAALATVLLLVLEGLPPAVKASIFLAGFVVAEATAETTASSRSSTGRAWPRGRARPS